MLIDTDEQISQKQLMLVGANAEPGVAPHVQRLLPLVQSSDHSHLLTLAEMSMPALKELSYKQYTRFSNNATQLITADTKVDIFEWVLHRVLMKELYPHFEGPQTYHGRIGRVAKVADEAALLLSILASHAHDDPEEQQRAYAVGAAALDISQPFSQQVAFDYQHINDALAKLRHLKPLVKPALIKACATAVLADGEVNSNEGALLHGIAATLDCPLPPNIYASPRS